VPFRTFKLRGERVLVRVDESGAPLASADGRVDILYKPGGKLYRAGARNLTPDAEGRGYTDAEAAPGEAAPQRTDKAESARKPTRGQVADGAVGAVSQDADAVIAYTDGGCSPNPGPMGVGVVLIDPRTGERRERYEFLGQGTNNIAELVAIQRAIELAPDDRGLVVHSDSSYALGILALGWKAKENQQLVAQLRELARAKKGLHLVKVRGHHGISENERADQLVKAAIATRTTYDSHVPSKK
jgi:ribonuclease HI